jgi:hypothetical protein
MAVLEDGAQGSRQEVSQSSMVCGTLIRCTGCIEATLELGAMPLIHENENHHPAPMCNGCFKIE